MLMKALILALACTFGIAGTFSKEQQRDIKSIIKSYLTENPEIITDALVHAQELEVQKMTQQAEDYLNKNSQDLLSQSAAYSQGPEHAKVHVIEFLDYKCGYCRSMFKTISNLKTIEPIKIAFMQMPILGPQSTKAATLALSASAENFQAVNNALFAAEGNLEDENLQNIAKQYNISMLADEQLEALLKTNYTWAMHLGIQGAPAIVISNGKSNKIFFGNVSTEKLQQSINELLQEKTTTNNVA